MPIRSIPIAEGKCKDLIDSRNHDSGRRNRYIKSAAERIFRIYFVSGKPGDCHQEYFVRKEHVCDHAYGRGQVTLLPASGHGQGRVGDCYFSTHRPDEKPGGSIECLWYSCAVHEFNPEQGRNNPVKEGLYKRVGQTFVRSTRIP